MSKSKYLMSNDIFSPLSKPAPPAAVGEIKRGFESHYLVCDIQNYP